MRIVRTALVIALAAASLPAWAGKPVKPAKPSKPAKVALACPVTGEKIASVAKAAGKSVYKGKTYYFCCIGCKAPFDKNPGKYLKLKT